MNKFAIILATIGRESLPEAIQSVLSQTYTDFVLLISYDRHDAFSTFSKQFPDKRIVHISPGNLASSNDSGANARNYAMQFVPPDCNWICYIDDDDVWHENRLARFNAFIEESDPSLDIFYSYGDLWKFKHRSPRSSRKEPKRIGVVDNVTCGGMCHRPDIFQRTSGWNPGNTEDHDRELYEAMSKHARHQDVLEEATFDFYWR